MTTLFHTTDHAAEILADGFTDGTGSYGFSQEVSGVFLSVVPATEQDGAIGGDVLEVTIPEWVDLDDYAIVEDCIAGIACVGAGSIGAAVRRPVPGLEPARWRCR